MRYDQKLKDEYYAATAKAYAKIDQVPFIRKTFEEMLQVKFEGKQIIDYLQGSKILDLGCGSGRLFPYLKKSYVVGVDASKEMLKYARQVMTKCRLRGKFVQKDLFHFKSNQKFDIAISIGVLGEHVPFTMDLARNVFQALKPEGLFVFTVVPLKKRWLSLLAKQLLQWGLILPRLSSWKKQLNSAAFMGYFAHSKSYVERTLKNVGFKEVKCVTVLKKSYEHYEFIARK
ncbi:MAG TPA: class I SAM-dependent methyltransferase [Candidatus Nanoarchaeia archaeon]|nr:class I SAM-dependent methyltransferase [Candidatus Nanoarchaeia archaeon]